jgi:anti-anti-sigma factor
MARRSYDMSFSMSSELVNGIAKVTLAGELDASVAGEFRNAIEAIAVDKAKRLVLLVSGLTYMASAGLRALVFARQKMGATVDIYVIGLQDAVRETLEMTGFQQSVVILPEYDAAEIEAV